MFVFVQRKRKSKKERKRHFWASFDLKHTDSDLLRLKVADVAVVAVVVSATTTTICTVVDNTALLMVRCVTLGLVHLTAVDASSTTNITCHLDVPLTAVVAVVVRVTAAASGAVSTTTTIKHVTIGLVHAQRQVVGLVEDAKVV